MHSVNTRVTAVAVAGLLLLAACGSGGDATSTPTADTQPADTGSQSADTTTTAADTGTGTPATTAGSDSAAASSPTANPDEDFFRDKTITLVIASSPGGTFDTVGRLVAQHMSEHVPGNPTIVAQNMPGAGHMVAANYMANVAENDGTVMAIMNSTLLTLQLIGDEGVQFQMEEFNWLGATTPTTEVCIARADSGVTTLEDVYPGTGNSIRWGHAGPGTTRDYGTLARTELGADIQLVAGFDGNTEVRLGVERGDIDGYCTIWETAPAAHQAWVDAGEFDFNYIAQFGLEPVADLPDATFVYGELDDDGKALMRVLVAPDRFFGPFLTPPGTPEGRVAVLRDALMATLDDPDFRQDAENAVGLTPNPLTGEEVAQIIDEVVASPESLVDQVRAILED